LPIANWRYSLQIADLRYRSALALKANRQLAIGNWQSAIAPDHANMLHKSGSTAIVWFFQPNLTVSFQ
jgi:hypothetical protein